MPESFVFYRLVINTILLLSEVKEENWPCVKPFKTLESGLRKRRKKYTPNLPQSCDDIVLTPEYIGIK